MAKNNQPEEHFNENSLSSQQSEMQLQEQLARYHDIAQQLYQSNTYEQAEEALTPIDELDEQDQLTFLNALSRERNEDAASILLAVNTITTRKDVRKEARRSLIRLESVNIYSRWAPPQLPSLIDSLSELTLPTSDDDFFEEDEEDDEDDGDENEDLDDEDENESDDADAVIEDFIEAWAEQDYETAYSLLASDSPLLNDLEQDEWIALRERWAEQAQPARAKVEVGYSYKVDESDVDALDDGLENDDETTQELDAFWSLEYQETPLDSQLPELPTATLRYPLTKRHWFWASYSLVREEDEWFIHHLADRGAEALDVEDEVLNERIDAIAGEVDAMPVNQLFAQLEDEEEIEDDDSDDDEEDEEEPFDLEAGEVSTIDQLEETYWFTTQALHYVDGLIAHNPHAMSHYERAASFAHTLMEEERVAAYFALAAQNIPEQRGDALRAQATTSYRAFTDALNDEEIEDEDISRYVEQAEQVLRESLAVNQGADDYMLLAQLIEREERLDEAEQLYQQAEAAATDSQTRATAEFGLGRVAIVREQQREAITHLQRAAELAPDLPGIQYTLGDLYYNSGQTARAEECYMRSTELDPHTEDAYAALATIWGEQGKKQQVMQIIEKGIEANPQSASLIALLAIQYIDQKNYRLADELLSQAEQFDPDSEVITLARQILATIRTQSKQGKQQSNKRKKR